MTRYDAATIKRARTILANAEAQQNSRKATVKATVKREAAWRSGKASKGQMDRINLAYGQMGLRTFRTITDFRAVFATAGAASDEFQRPVVKAAYYSAR